MDCIVCSAHNQYLYQLKGEAQNAQYDTDYILIDGMDQKKTGKSKKTILFYIHWQLTVDRRHVPDILQKHFFVFSEFYFVVNFH